MEKRKLLFIVIMNLYQENPRGSTLKIMTASSKFNKELIINV